LKKILLADDSITIQKVVELTFSEADFQVVCVSNGAQALRKISEMRPDIVLLDVIMPEKNGYEVCEQLKRAPSTSGIPVLLLTGTFEPFDKKRAEAAGANGHLTKPFESQVLVSKVEELIRSTPTVVSDEEAGVMNVISGGDIYQVGSRPGEGLRPIVPSIAAAQQGPPAALPPTAEPATAPEGGVLQRPKTISPDPAHGGSYVGFADIGLGLEEEGEIVPDRFDEDANTTPATVRMRREDLFPGSDNRFGGSSVTPEAGDVSVDASGPIEGLTGSFESQFERPPGEGAAGAPQGVPPHGDPKQDTDWTPPPEAPPVEAWQSVGQDEPAGPASIPPVAGPDVPPLAMTPEVIELIAERVVQRMSDRVVREIAWEVIPEVAEAIVRRRIKELEEQGPS
jgi:CheY-like chemotaxis protein